MTNRIGLPVTPLGDDWMEYYPDDEEEEDLKEEKDLKEDLKVKEDLNEDLKEDLKEDFKGDFKEEDLKEEVLKEEDLKEDLKEEVLKEEDLKEDLKEEVLKEEEEDDEDDDDDVWEEEDLLQYLMEEDMKMKGSMEAWNKDLKGVRRNYLIEDLTVDSSEEDSDDDDDPLSEKRLLAMTRSILKPVAGPAKPRSNLGVRFKLNKEQRAREKTKGPYREFFDFQHVAKRERKGKIDLKTCVSKLFTPEMVEEFAESLRLTPEGYSSDTLTWLSDKKKKKKKKEPGLGSSKVSSGTGTGKPKKKREANGTGAAKINGTPTPRLKAPPAKAQSGRQEAVKAKPQPRGKKDAGKETLPVPDIEDRPNPAKKTRAKRRGMLTSFANWKFNGKSKKFRREFEIFMEHLRQFQLKELSVAYETKDDVTVSRSRSRPTSTTATTPEKRNAEINGDKWVHLMMMRPLFAN